MKFRHLIMLTAFSGLTIAITSCSSDKKITVNRDSLIKDSTERQAAARVLKPMGPAPDWGKTIQPEMQVVMEKLASYGDKPIESLTAVAARKNHTPTDAVMDVIAENTIVVPAPKCDTTGKNIDVPGGKVHLRIYTPTATAAPLPVIVYYHGGGFVIANIDVYNASAQALCEQTGAIVVSVAYRLAPEHKFPVAHNDSFAAYEWVTKNAGAINLW